MLDITKEIVSESYQVPFLSDIEMLAYTKKEERIKVYRIVKELKETSISLKARAYLRDWIGRKVKSYLK
jgi:protein involved in ribonucleotide reduction